MSGSRIGGPLDYHLLARLHRPDDAGLAAEARRLAREGLTAADIAMALRVHRTQVETWLLEVA